MHLCMHVRIHSCIHNNIIAYYIVLYSSVCDHILNMIYVHMRLDGYRTEEPPSLVHVGSSIVAAPNLDLAPRVAETSAKG